MSDAMKTIDFFVDGDYLHCYGSDALLVARELGLVRLTVDQRHATDLHPAGTSHTFMPVHSLKDSFNSLKRLGWNPKVVSGTLQYLYDCENEPCQHCGSTYHTSGNCAHGSVTAA